MAYDPLLTMSALNLAVVSLHRITSAEDRVILDREYTSIINNLRMGEINADPELTGLYQEIVRVIQRGRLRDDERKAVKAGRYEHKQRSIREIISDNVLKTFSLNPMEWLGNLTRSCVSEYFGSAKEEEEPIRRSQDENLRLRREELDEYAELQSKLLLASWNLLNKYKLPDEYRLTDRALKNFYAVMQDDDSSRRLRRLKRLEGEFVMYSPYWFYRAGAAQEAGDKTEAGKSLGKFREVWRPVLRRDPYKAEALKFTVEELVKDGITQESAEKILGCLAEIRANTELDDWANNIYMGMTYFTLGRKDEAVDCVLCNIDSDYETGTSGKLLAKFEREIPPKRFAPNPAKTSEPPEIPKPAPLPPKPAPTKDSLAERAERGDHEAQYKLGMMYYEGDGVWLDYEKAVFWLKTAGEAGQVEAQLQLCSMYYSGEGVPQDKEQAFSWLEKAAEQGSAEAQYRLAGRYLKRPNVQKAILWCRKAAEQNYPEAQKLLGDLYRDSGDKRQSEYWYKQAGKNVVTLEEKPAPEVPKPEPVKGSLKKRAENGDPEAQYQLGMRCKNRWDWLRSNLSSIAVCAGLIVCVLSFYFMRSPSFWWNIIIFPGSVILGLIVGILGGNLAVFGFHTIRTIRGAYLERAKSWLTKAAENGHTEAMYLLGNIYYFDEHKRDGAKSWYKKAAMSGHIGAQEALSAIYRNRLNGDCRAYMWAYLAYLCGGSKNLADKPNVSYYPISLSDAMEAEAEALKMYDDIQRRRQNTNSKEA